jgi:hypothetical protein
MKFLNLIYIAVLFFGYSISSYSAILDIRNGVLFGASEVDVNGALFDVQFKDGTCIELFDDCDENTDFPFTNPANLNDGVLLRAAMQALLDQVFVDSSLGAFDNEPNLMNGCNVPGGCNIATPLWVNGSGGLGVFVTHNWTPEHRDVISAGGSLKTFDTRPVPGLVEDISVYAVWNQSDAPNVECTLDADGNKSVDALTDGLLFIRYMFGIRGVSLVEDAIANNCSLCVAAEIEPILDQCATTGTSDIDGNGNVDALTDGLLLIRFIFGIRGDALIIDSVGNACSRCTELEIEGYIQGLIP